MFSSSILNTMFVLCMAYQDASAVPTVDKFQIRRLTTIETTEGPEKKYIFPETMLYQVQAGARGDRFTLNLVKYKTLEPAQTIQFVDTVLFTSAHQEDNTNFTPHQVAFYKDPEGYTFLAEKCDTVTETCVLAGSIYYDGKRWEIEPVDGTPTIYHATRSDEENVDRTAILHDAHAWKGGEGEPMSISPQESHRVFKREVRHRRDVSTTCNIFEVVAVGDASVWQYFLARNSQNATAASIDARLHYDALIRENSSTDWTTLTGTGNVNITAGLETCAQTIFADADAPLCFTRIPMQFLNIVDGIRAAATIGNICSNETIEAGLFEDFHDGLPRLVAFVNALQIDNDTLVCSNSAAFNNTFNVDDQSLSEPANTADYPLTYMFSNCSVNILTLKIDQLNNDSNNCLLRGNLTDAQFLELANHRLLAGEIIDINHQCQLAFGVESNMCDLYNFSSGMVVENDAICGAGEFCTSNGTCGIDQTIVYSGTPCGTNKICFKGACRNIFDCGGLPTPPNGFYTLNPQGDTTFLAEATLNCFSGFSTSTNITIKCRREGWAEPAENCAVPTTTTPMQTTSQGQIAIG